MTAKRPPEIDLSDDDAALLERLWREEGERAEASFAGPDEPRDAHGRWTEGGAGHPAETARLPKVGSKVKVGGYPYVVESTDDDDTFPPIIAGYELKDGHLFYTGRNGSEGVVSGTREDLVKWAAAVDREVKRRPPAQEVIRDWTPADGGAENVAKAKAAARKTAETFGLDPAAVERELSFGHREADHGLGGDATEGRILVVNAHKDQPHAFDFDAPGVTAGMHFAAHETAHRAFSADHGLGQRAAADVAAATKGGGHASLYGALSGPFESLMEAAAAYVTAPEALKKHNPALYDAVGRWAEARRAAAFFDPSEARDPPHFSAADRALSAWFAD